MIENSNPEGDGLKASLGRLSDRRVVDLARTEQVGLTRERSKSANHTEKVAKTVAAFGSVVIGWLAPLSRCIERKPATTTEKYNVINP